MRELDRVREICLGLPDVNEKASHGEPTWFVKKRTFASFAFHHHDNRVAVWCAAPPGIQELLIGSSPNQFFRPPYVGPSGWVGIYLDVDVDWDEVGEILRQAHAHIEAKSSRKR
ncbi:MAG TPA: MmcQ/YjbR family DNA-binding protein [Fimbriimonadaceae bacterium]|nr:MmcQ/YjbR family DNA-binding protein [Fimbriimonadaceae bacterium]